MYAFVLQVGLIVSLVTSFQTAQNPATRPADKPSPAKVAATDPRAIAWLARQKEQVSPEEYALLARAQATLLGNIGDPNDILAGGGCGGRGPEDRGKPLPWNPRRGIYPSPFKYRGVWSWDGQFHAVAVARWDPELAREQFQIILDQQQESGLLPDVVMETGEVVKDFGKPPVLPWAMVRVDRIVRGLDPSDTQAGASKPDEKEIAANLKFLESTYPQLIAYEKHLMANRGGREDGLFHYAGPIPNFESGWDNSVRWDQGCDNLWAIDFNCYMVMMYESMAYIAERVGRKEDVAMWQKRAREVAERINDTLWNETAGAYMDRNRQTREFTGVLSPASFMPLYVKIASPERAARMAKLAADPQKFFPGMPAVSYDHPEYRSSEYWRGPTWVNVAYFALKGLKQYGHDRVADDCRKTILEWCSKNPDHLWEYYDSKSGKGLGAPQYGWTGTFVIELILNWQTQP